MSALNIFKKQQTPQPNEETQPKKTMLIVEDDLYLRDFYKELFANQGYNIITSNNGIEGLDSALKNIPDIILLDIIMPKMDGNQVLEKLRDNESTKKIPVIILTNAGNINNMDTAKYFAVYKFFIKSNVSPGELLNAVSEALGTNPSPTLS
jgi:CheY-like chemotaxis protein